MGIFDKLFGKQEPAPPPAVPPRPDPTAAPARGDEDEGEPIRMMDEYGREFLITRQVWRSEILPANIQSQWNNPDALFAITVNALDDGLAADVIDAARRLHETDPDPTRGACLYAIVLMKNGRLDDAERVLQAHLRAHGDDGVVLTNLAKVYAARNDDARAEETLQRGLRIDPNQDNGLSWYVAWVRERRGDGAVVDALRAIAALPGSWRAQLWLAREALKAGDREQALALYHESLSRAADPVPADALMQISGDLGNAGMVAELLRLVGPRFDAARHGLMVGNNLIKANLDGGRVEPARRILEKLYAQERPDWKDTLAFWDRQIAQASLPAPSHDPEQPIRLELLAIPAPMWLPAALSSDGEPADDGVTIRFLGGTAEKETTATVAEAQLADEPGRLSRAVPLFLAEQVALTTAARVDTLIPWVAGDHGGFVLSGTPFGDDDGAEWAAQGERPADFVVLIHIDARQEPFTVGVRLVRTSDALCIGTLGAHVAPGDPVNPGPWANRLASELLTLLREEADVPAVRPAPLYPPPAALGNYLLRLEQHLAVRMAARRGGRLNGERDIVEGILLLCLDEPRNAATRLLLVETLRAMNTVRPDVVRAFAPKVRLLQREHPLPPDENRTLESTLAEILPPPE